MEPGKVETEVVRAAECARTGDIIGISLRFSNIIEAFLMSTHNILHQNKKKILEIIPNTIMSAAMGFVFVRDSITSSK